MATREHLEDLETIRTSDGVRLALARHGPADGPPVLLLHGFPEDRSAFRRQIGMLVEEGLHVVVPDLRGYGDSDAPDSVAAYAVPRLAEDVREIALHVGGGRALALVGHDWGGVIAFAAAAADPQLFSRLVVLNAPHLDAFERVVRRRPSQLVRSLYVGAFQIPLLPEAALAADDFALLRRLLTASAAPGLFSRAELDRYARGWEKPGRLSGMLAYYRALLRHPAPKLGRIRVPTTILWGMKDVALDTALAVESRDLCRDARLALFPRASHWIQHEEPEAVSVAILEAARATA